MRKICITGPEATGKSTLASSLARAYESPWVPEYAREYLQDLQRPYNLEDLDEIVIGQCWAEEVSAKTMPHLPFLFCDTGPEVVWIWSEYKYGSVSPTVKKMTYSARYDLTLLLDVDLPWVEDPLRETPELAEREILLQMYKDLLKHLGRPYHIIKGTGEDREKNAHQLLGAKS